MPWWDILKRKEPGAEDGIEQPAKAGRAHLPMASHDVRTIADGHIIGRRVDPNDPATQERRRKRLEQRVQNLQYDVQQAEGSLVEPNRWTGRFEQLTLAVEQARRDSEAILSAPPGQVGIPLPPWQVTVTEARATAPADIALRIGEIPFRYREEIDWAERGHQKAPVQLQRVEGDLDLLMPASLPDERRDELRGHLAHSLSILVEQIREGTLDGEPLQQVTLADLATPCPECGGWQDVKGRCPACQERQWKSAALRADMERLIKERNETLDDMQRLRDRLPMLRRQLADARTQLAALEGPAEQPPHDATS